jgi:hypothetical protein
MYTSLRCIPPLGGWRPNCHLNQKETPSHLLLYCPSQSESRKKSINKLDKKDRSLYHLFMTKSGQEKLIQFLHDSKIATRKWLLCNLSDSPIWISYLHSLFNWFDSLFDTTLFDITLFDTTLFDTTLVDTTLFDVPSWFPYLTPLCEGI